jgi:transcriptional regulator with XRE-family HTH domain
MNNILENIEAIRKAKHIKQEVLASELGIKQSSYSSYITRASDITFSRLLQISKVLDMSVVDIITWPEKYVPESEAQSCKRCEEKDSTIMHLNRYIALLERRLNPS